jgi:hypothetical protein
MTSILLDTVDTPASAQPGESVHVQVALTAEAPPDTVVTVAGIQTTDAWLQAPGRLGEWRFLVVATAG